MPGLAKRTRPLRSMTASSSLTCSTSAPSAAGIVSRFGRQLLVDRCGRERERLDVAFGVAVGQHRGRHREPVLVGTFEGQATPPPALADERGEAFDHEVALRPVVEQFDETRVRADDGPERTLERLVAPTQLAPARAEDGEEIRGTKRRLYEHLVVVGEVRLGFLDLLELVDQFGRRLDPVSGASDGPRRGRSALSVVVADLPNDRAVLVVQDLEGGGLDPAIAESHLGERTESGSSKGVAGQRFEHGPVLGADLDRQRVAQNDLAREDAGRLHSDACTPGSDASSF